MAIKTLEGLIDPTVRAKMRHALSRETSGVIKGIMTRTGCDVEKAMDTLEHWVRTGVVRLLLQPNGECLIDLVPTEAEVTEIIVDAEVNRINNGRTTIEREGPKIVTGRTVSEPARKKRRLH